MANLSGDFFCGHFLKKFLLYALRQDFGVKTSSAFCSHGLRYIYHYLGILISCKVCVVLTIKNTYEKYNIIYEIYNVNLILLEL